MLKGVCQIFFDFDHERYAEMSSTTKTLALLGHFTPMRPEIGLSQMCRLAKRDKASTYRHLQALEETGFVEQNPVSKLYRLGPAVLQLAQIRELTVPRKSGAEPVLHTLAEATGETTHCSVLSGGTVYSLLSCDSVKHSTRVVIDVQTFPLHATASGLCALAFGPAALLDTARENLSVFTAQTVKDENALIHEIEVARRTGFARTLGTFETEVSSLAAPLFDQTGLFTGSVSVACVATRFTPSLEFSIYQHLITASRAITRNWGGQIPETIEAAWAETLSTSAEMEPAT